MADELDGWAVEPTESPVPTETFADEVGRVLRDAHIDTDGRTLLDTIKAVVADLADAQRALPKWISRCIAAENAIMRGDDTMALVQAMQRANDAEETSAKVAENCNRLNNEKNAAEAALRAALAKADTTEKNDGR